MLFEVAHIVVLGVTERTDVLLVLTVGVGAAEATEGFVLLLLLLLLLLLC